MHKYLEVIKIAYSLQLAYRGGMLIRCVRDIVTVLFFVLLWSALFRKTSVIGGYTLPSIITYYIIARIIDQLYSYEPARLLSRDIRQGDLSNYLVKPWKYVLYLASYTFGRRFARTTFSFLAIGLVFVLVPQFVVLPSSILYLLYFIISAVLSWVLLFEMIFVLGALSFWISETGGIRTAFEQMTLVLGGLWVPLDLFPKNVLYFLSYLPFKYFYFNLVQIYQGKISSSQITSGIWIQIIWMAAFGLLTAFLWKKGIKVYGAFGK